MKWKREIDGKRAVGRKYSDTYYLQEVVSISPLIGLSDGLLSYRRCHLLCSRVYSRNRISYERLSYFGVLSRRLDNL